MKLAGGINRGNSFLIKQLLYRILLSLWDRHARGHLRITNQPTHPFGKGTQRWKEFYRHNSFRDYSTVFPAFRLKNLQFLCTTDYADLAFFVNATADNRADQFAYNTETSEGCVEMQTV